MGERELIPLHIFNDFAVKVNPAPTGAPFKDILTTATALAKDTQFPIYIGKRGMLLGELNILVKIFSYTFN